MIITMLYNLFIGERTVNRIHQTVKENPEVDFRNLNSNDEIQVLLEKGASGLGYTYKSKQHFAVLIL